MSWRFRSYLLVFVLIGALLDGGTLGFRAVWASCGDWLQGSAADTEQHASRITDQVSSAVTIAFENTFLRDDETAGHRSPKAGKQEPCGPGNPNCSLRKQQPSPLPPWTISSEVQRSAWWSDSWDSDTKVRVGSAVLHRCTGSTYFSAEIFRPPRAILSAT